jgi:hypothetical protein
MVASGRGVSVGGNVVGAVGSIVFVGAEAAVGARVATAIGVAALAEKFGVGVDLVSKGAQPI